MDYTTREALERDLEFVRLLHEASMRPHAELQFGAWDTALQKTKFADVAVISNHHIIEVDGVPIWMLQRD